MFEIFYYFDKNKEGKLIKNPEWARKLGRNGREKVKGKFTIEIYVKQIYEVLQEITDKKKIKVNKEKK